MFTVTVPKGFTPEQRLTWTLTANGRTTVIPLRLHPDYGLNPFQDVAVENTPPILRLIENGPPIQGPIAALARAETRTVKAGQPLPLAAWVADDGKYTSGSNARPAEMPPPVEIEWSPYRGPGRVTFDAVKPVVTVLAGGGVNVAFRGLATTMATFSEPGDYVLHVNVDDFSGRGSGETGCCWTTTLVKVTVTP
jgi:hypothetical protein